MLHNEKEQILPIERGHNKWPKAASPLFTCKSAILAAACFLSGLIATQFGGYNQEGAIRIVENVFDSFKHKANGPFHWKQCSRQAGPHYLCGYLTVPLDYTNASDPRTVTMATTMYQPKPGRKSKRTLVIEPGGPGGSGTNYVWRKGADFSHSFTDGQYDVLGFDPRGVNLTDPAISCYSSDEYRSRWSWTAFTWPQLWGNQALQQFDAMNEASFMACKSSWKDIPRFLTTAFVARDVESIREALGEDELTAFMVSYGTGIGQTYAQMFPDRVGRVVLDGCEFVVDHREKWGFGETSLDNVTAAFEDGFVGECVKSGPDNCALALSPLNTTKQGAYEAAQSHLSTRLHSLFDRVKQRPIPGITKYGPGIITYEVLVELLYQTLYNPPAWPTLADIFTQLERGNATSALEAYLSASGYNPEKKAETLPHLPHRKHYSSEFPSSSELGYMVICGDAYDGEDKPLAWWAELGERMIKKSWISGTPRLYGSLPCRHYDWIPAEVYRGGFNHTLKNPLLLIAETYDPATPLRNARRLAEAMGHENARLIHHHGYGHSSTRDISACTNNLVKSILLNGTIPEATETDCYADERPYPAGGAKFDIADFGRF